MKWRIDNWELPTGTKLYLAPPANDEAVRLADNFLASWQEETGREYDQNKISQSNYRTIMHYTTTLRTILTTHNAQEGKDNG